MKKFFLILFTMLLLVSLSQAAVRRVGYAGVPLAGVDYPDFTSAEAASTSGDTIQVYGGSNNGTVTKRLIIIGFGYNFDVHPGLQAIGTDAPSNISLSFELGSDGSIATGLSGSFSVVDYSNTVGVSNITFLRCLGSFNLTNYITYGPISNIKILSSVINSGGMTWGAGSGIPVTNLQVFNCYVYGFNLYLAGTNAVFINCVTAAPSIVGNYALGLNDASVLVKNCILGAAGPSNVNTVFENNFFAEPQPVPLPPGSNNRWNQDWAILFNRITSANDNASFYSNPEFDENYFVLKAGSPAINGGFDGNGVVTNCGIYGGEALYIYRPSGVPAIPSIYKLTAPAINANSNPYNVTISVKSNN